MPLIMNTMISIIIATPLIYLIWHWVFRKHYWNCDICNKKIYKPAVIVKQGKIHCDKCIERSKQNESNRKNSAT